MESKDYIIPAQAGYMIYDYCVDTDSGEIFSNKYPIISFLFVKTKDMNHIFSPEPLSLQGNHTVVNKFTSFIEYTIPNGETIIYNYDGADYIQIDRNSINDYILDSLMYYYESIETSKDIIKEKIEIAKKCIENQNKSKIKAMISSF